MPIAPFARPRPIVAWSFSCSWISESSAPSSRSTPRNHGAGDVRALVRDRLVDLDGPLGVVRLGDVDAAVVAVVVAQRARDALDREPVEPVGRELELKEVLVGLSLELQPEPEQVLLELLVAGVGATGEPAQLVGVDVDDGHQ